MDKLEHTLVHTIYLILFPMFYGEYIIIDGIKHSDGVYLTVCDLSAYFLSAFLMKKSHLSAPLNRGCLFFQIRVQGYAVKALIVFAEYPRQLGTAKLGEIFPEGTLKHIHSVCALSFG